MDIGGQRGIGVVPVFLNDVRLTLGAGDRGEASHDDQNHSQDAHRTYGALSPI